MAAKLTPQDVRRLAKAGENEHVEFKRKIAHPLKVAKELVAFANARGGTLLVGVDDNRTVPGLNDPDGDEFLLDRALALACRPHVPHKRYRVPITDDTWVLVYEVEEGTEKPYALLENDEETVYIRVEDRAIQASKELRQILRQQKKDRPYRFEFGAKEKQLVTAIEAQGYISLPDFAKLAAVPERQASRTLVLLVLAGLLELVPSITGDRYRIKPAPSENTA
jgi:predicted HTH transcriptional regulator